MQRLREHFREFSIVERRRTPLYSAITAALADHEVLAEVYAETPVNQQRAMLLLAALHERVLVDPTGPFARCYPTITREPADPLAAGRLAAAYCVANARAIRARMARAATQTNEVGRAAAVRAGLASIDTDAPLALIELGASAGLLLRADAYRIEYGAGLEAGPIDAPVRIEVELRGAAPPTGPIRIAERLGIDLDPVDLTDDTRARWLLACVWADDLPRFDRLAEAIAFARTSPVRLQRADAVAVLPEALRATPDAAHPVVITAWAMTYLSPAQRGRIVDELTRVAAARDLTWLSLESPEQTPDLPRPAAPLRRPGATDLVAWTARRGRITVHRLAELHPHGRWLDWQLDTDSAV